MQKISATDSGLPNVGEPEPRRGIPSRRIITICMKNAGILQHETIGDVVFPCATLPCPREHDKEETPLVVTLESRPLTRSI